MRGGHNQYPPGPGIPALRAAIAAHQRRFYGIEVDPDGEVLVTTGATEAIAAALLALCEPGDEVVTFEPYYDSYAACIALAGARRRPGDAAAARLRDRPRRARRRVLAAHPARPAQHAAQPDRQGLHAARSWSWSRSHCRERDVLAVTDEVYEHLVYDGREHVPLATLPGMAERTLTISSAGKTFSRHRLEDRLGDAARARSSRPCRRPSSSSRS